MDSNRFNWEGRNSPALFSLLGVSIQKADALTKFPVLISHKCGYFHVDMTPSCCRGYLSLPCAWGQRGRLREPYQKVQLQLCFQSCYRVSMETRMTFQSFSGEGTAFTAIQSLQLKFCKIATQGECFLSKKPAVHLLGGSEPLLTLPQNLAFLSRSLHPAFQLDFMGEEGSQHPLLTPNPFPRCLGMEGGGGQGWAGVSGGPGVRGCSGKATRQNTHLASGAGLVWGCQG